MEEDQADMFATGEEVGERKATSLLLLTSPLRSAQSWVGEEEAKECGAKGADDVCKKPRSEDDVNQAMSKSS